MTTNLWKYIEKCEGRFMTRWVHYIDIYEQYLAPYKDMDFVKMLEIGIFQGGSLQMWKHYFGDKLSLTALDIYPNRKQYEEPGITIEIGDQEDKQFMQKVGKQHGLFDIVIDDGGHYPKQQINTFEELWPFITSHGIYICEDTHTSYLPKYTTTHLTFIEYTRSLIDQLHGWYDEHYKTNLTRSIKAIHFYDSMVIIEKCPPKDEPCQLFAGKMSDEIRVQVEALNTRKKLI